MIARVLWYWLHLRRNQWLPKRQLNELQFKKLKKMMIHAYINVPFYKRLYDQQGVRPDELRTFDDLRRFPILTKELARDTPLEERTAVGTEVSRCILKTTSGSTGIPVKVLEEETCIDYLDAHILRRLFEYGYRPWEKILRYTNEPPREGNLTTAGETRTGIMKMLYERRVKRLVITDDVDKHVKIIKAERPHFIYAPASYLKVVARTMHEQDVRNIRPRVLMTWGEILDDATRVYLAESFGSRVYDGYGCNEVAQLGGLAWECKERTGLHVNMDVSYLEFLKDGEPVSPGEKGEVVATSLFRFATPMIRYSLGDLVTLSDEACRCRREMPLIKNIEGRLVDFLKMPDGRLISPYAVMFAIQDLPGIARYQVEQESQTRIIVTVEKSREFSQETVRQIREACTHLFKSGVDIEVEVIETFPITLGKKFRHVKSHLH